MCSVNKAKDFTVAHCFVVTTPAEGRDEAELPFVPQGVTANMCDARMLPKDATAGSTIAFWL